MVQLSISIITSGFVVCFKLVILVEMSTLMASAPDVGLFNMKSL